MKEIKFEMEDAHKCKTPCPFGKEALVNSNACEECENFVKSIWNERVSCDAPISGTVYCNGGEHE